MRHNSSFFAFLSTPISEIIRIFVAKTKDEFKNV